MKRDMRLVVRIGHFETSEFSRLRNPTIDMLAQGRNRHHIPMLSASWTLHQTIAKIDGQ